MSQYFKKFPVMNFRETFNTITKDPIIYKDKFEFTVESGHWVLQRICLYFLKKLKCYAVVKQDPEIKSVVECETIVVHEESLSDFLIENIYDLQRICHEEIDRIVMGPEHWMSIVGNSRTGFYANCPVDLKWSNGKRVIQTFHGIDVQVIQGCDKPLLLPKIKKH